MNSTPDLVAHFRNDTLAPHAKHRTSLTPVPAEESNWRDEQRAWRETAILFNQLFHMPELFVRGRDAFNLLNYVGINSFEKFVPGRAKSFLGCAPSGHVIGECLLHQHGPEDFELISGQYLINWVQYVAETAGYDVNLQLDNAIWDHPSRSASEFSLWSRWAQARTPHRQKVTLVLNAQDVQRVFASLWEPALPYKFMEMPTAHYSMQQADEVRGSDGRLIGLSSFCGYTMNERAWLSLALVDEADATVGSKVSLLWGEPDGGTRKPHVERHRQVEIRATIAPCPYARTVQELQRATIGKPIEVAQLR